MNRPIIPSLLITLAVYVGGCQNNGDGGGDDARAASGGDANLESTFHGLANQHCQALLKKDWAALERLWADDLTFVNPRGELLSKANRLENLRTGATSFKSINVTEERHRAVGRDAGVTTCRVKIEGQYSGQEGSGDYRVTFVWGSPSGNWQLKALQMTRIEPR